MARFSRCGAADFMLPPVKIDLTGHCFRSAMVTMVQGQQVTDTSGRLVDSVSEAALTTFLNIFDNI